MCYTPPTNCLFHDSYTIRQNHMANCHSCMQIDANPQARQSKLCGTPNVNVDVCVSLCAYARTCARHNYRCWRNLRTITASDCRFVVRFVCGVSYIERMSMVAQPVVTATHRLNETCMCLCVSLGFQCAVRCFGTFDFDSSNCVVVLLL